MQPTLGIGWDPPQPKLRVRYGVTSTTFGHFISKQLSAPCDGLLEQCFAGGIPVSGEEVLQVGGHDVVFYVMAGVRDFEAETGHAREVLSLLLSSGAVPSSHAALPTLWEQSAMGD